MLIRALLAAIGADIGGTLNFDPEKGNSIRPKPLRIRAGTTQGKSFVAAEG